LTHLRDLAPAVAAEGIEVRVVCADARSAAAFEAASVEAVVRPLRHKLDVAGAARVARLADADIVHTHDRRTGLLVRPLARAAGAHSVHTLHGVPDELFRAGRPPGRARGSYGLARPLVRLEHGVLGMEALLSRLGTLVVPSASARRLRNRGRLSGRTPTRDTQCASRFEGASPTAHDPPVIGTAALLERRKGVDVLLEASAQLKTPHRLLIYGDGSQRRELEAQAARSGSHVGFRGFVPDLVEQIEELDVFDPAERGENLPIAILEAMASAVPVVATFVGGVPEVVVDGETGC
jgi:glycosyltransferase involved in cell wall biosynthesis